MKLRAPHLLAALVALAGACNSGTDPSPATADAQPAGDAAAADAADTTAAPDGAAGDVASGASGDATGDASGDAADTAADAAPIEGPVVTPDGCNPIAAEWDCLLPFPSDVFLRPDPSLPGGRRLDVPDGAVPRDLDGVAPDFEGVHPTDGFSPSSQIGVFVPGGLDPAPLVAHTEDRAASTQPTSPTLLLDAETGERVAHFAELDARQSPEKGAILLIRPARRLKDDHRYVLALHGLVHPDGAAVAPPASFAALRDGGALTPTLAALAPAYEQRIFPVVQAAGVPRGDLQLAWELTTATEERSTGDLLAVREDAMALLAAASPAVTVDAVQDDVDALIARRIEGTLTVPLYLDKAEPGGTLARGDDGRPVRTGDATVPFTLQIPRSVWDGTKPAPARFLQFGHGFFGSREEADGGFVREYADRAGMAVACIDWWGMSKADLPVVLESMVLTVSHTMDFTDRVHQAMVNQMALAYALPALAELPETANGSPLIDPAHVYFYGISQGHILGSVYVTVSPHIERATLAVGGGGFGLMMSRAHPFAAFLSIIDARFGNDFLVSQKIVLLMQTSFDRIDPVSYAPHLLSDTYPGSPASRRVLQHVAIGDTSVPNLASHFFARSLDLPELAPVPRPLFGIPPVDPPAGSALVEWDFGVEIPDVPSRPVILENEVHEAQRALPASMDQVDAFLREGGLVESFCDGPCDPE